MIAALDFQTLAQLSAERMLNSAVEGLGIVAFAWILLRVIGKQNSGTRFAVWFAALASIAFLPFIERAGSGSFTDRTAISLPGSWAWYLFATWALGAVVCLARVGIGLWELHRLRSNSVPVADAQLPALLQQTLNEFRSIRPVTLCVSDDLRMPTAIGFLRPRVVFPAWAMKDFSPAELNSILLHELAHLERWDDCTNLAQKVLGALFFFHPAVWWIEAQLRLEREMACDDRVLARVESAKAYAACLVSLAEKGFLRRGLALAQAAISRVKDTTLRITQILDQDRPAATRVWKPALVLLGGFTFSAMVAIPHMPRLVSFAGAEPATQMASGTVDPVAVPVVPAKLLLPEPVHKALPAAPRHVAKSSLTPQAVAKHVRLTEARTTNAESPGTFLVVMQTEQFTAPDSSVVTLCVWRVTWIAPAHRTGVLAKSI